MPSAFAVMMAVTIAIAYGVGPSFGSLHVHRKGGRTVTIVMVPLQTAADRSETEH